MFNAGVSVDRDNWKRGSISNSYFPKKYPKDYQLKKDWEVLLSKFIKRFEIDKAVGGKDSFHQCGFDYTRDGLFFIFTDKPEIFDFPSDVIEISNLEYFELTKQE